MVSRLYAQSGEQPAYLNRALSAGSNGAADLVRRMTVEKKGIATRQPVTCGTAVGRCAAMTGGTAEARELGGRVADSWINFARKGDPNHVGLPKWPDFTAEKCPTMIFDDDCQLKNNPDGDERRVLTRA